MPGIREYIFSVAACGLICGILKLLPGKNSFNSRMMDMVCGIVLVVTFLQPIRNGALLQLDISLEDLRMEGSDIAAQGAQQRSDMLADIIKKETEAYILKKAQNYGAELSVEVGCREHNGLPIPEKVVIEGDIGPYGKQQIAKILAEEIGIPKERQEWK